MTSLPFFPYLTAGSTTVFGGSPTCEGALVFHSFPVIVVQHSLFVLLCGVGVVATSVMAFLFATHRVYHINLRILLTSVSLIVALRGASSFTRSTIFLYRTATYRSLCDLIWSFSSCRSLSKITSQPVMCVAYAYVALAIERIVATKFGRRYEQHHWPFLSILATIGVWYEYVYVVADSLSSLSSPSPIISVYCNSIGTPEYTWLSILVSFRTLPLTLVSLLLFAVVFLFNRGKVKISLYSRSQSLNLSSRFQVRETMKATRIVIPNALFYSVVFSIDIILTSVASAVQEHSTQLTALCIKETGSLSIAVFVCLHSFVHLWQSPDLRRRLRRGKRPGVTPLPSPNYDTIVTGLWEEALKAKEKGGLFKKKKTVEGGRAGVSEAISAARQSGDDVRASIT